MKNTPNQGSLRWHPGPRWLGDLVGTGQRKSNWIFNCTSPKKGEILGELSWWVFVFIKHIGKFLHVIGFHLGATCCILVSSAWSTQVFHCICTLTGFFSDMILVACEQVDESAPVCANTKCIQNGSAILLRGSRIFLRQRAGETEDAFPFPCVYFRANPASLPINSYVLC